MPSIGTSRIYSPQTSDSVGRTSAFIYAATVTVLFGFIPGVAADCWIDSYVVMTLARSTTLTLFSPTCLAQVTKSVTD